MGRWVRILLLSVSWTLILRVGVGLPYQGMAGHSWPDSLDAREYSGVVIVDTTAAVPSYMLDTNQNGFGDFILAFGPSWYSPGSGATRPAHGDAIPASASLTGRIDRPVLVVFSLAGADWRTPMRYGPRGWNMEPVWSSLTKRRRNGRIRYDLLLPAFVSRDRRRWPAGVCTGIGSDVVPARAPGAAGAWRRPEGGPAGIRRDLSRRALRTTETELAAIAPAAIIGESVSPKNGYSSPAATGMPSPL